MIDFLHDSKTIKHRKLAKIKISDANKVRQVYPNKILIRKDSTEQIRQIKTEVD